MPQLPLPLGIDSADAGNLLAGGHPSSERLPDASPLFLLLSPSNYVDLHELDKGWRAALLWYMTSRSRHKARQKNDQGNLPLHLSVSFRAPLDEIEGLLESYPKAALLTNNYDNLAVHFMAWKKRPLDYLRLLL